MEEEALSRQDLAASSGISTSAALVRPALRGPDPRGERAAQGLPHLHLSEVLGNVMFLERLLHGLTLVSAVQSALRARRRQLQVRGFLIQQERAAAALAEGEARLRIAMEAVDFGAWEYAVDTGERTASETFKANSGRAPTRLFPTRISSPRRTRRARAPGGGLRRSIAERASFDSEYRVVWPDGSLHCVQIRGTAIDRDDGSLRLHHISQDVTSARPRRSAASFSSTS